MSAIWTDATDLRPFVPRRWLRNGHVMTVFAWGRLRQFPALPAPEARLFRSGADTQVMAHCFWQPARASRPTIVALHGLEASSAAHYMRGLADKAWRRGWNAVLLNQRNCGGTEHLTPGLYHSGLTDDPRAVIRELSDVDGLSRIGVIGYSLGGNIAIKLAGELGDTPELPVKGVAAVSPTIDLERCVRSIERRPNYPYQWNFVRNLRARMRRMAQAWPGAFDLTPLDRIWTIRKFDDVYTAPYHGFNGASDYYHRASAIRGAHRIKIPALILTAKDDPFVPAEQFSESAVSGNRWITVRIEPHGGHCGFVGEMAVGENGDADSYWAETTAIRFLAPLIEP
jgi:predicted alpha/beta-fold hydrolase